ncbi:MAG: hypothetical protein AB1486_21205 [Planctomycetota bacterium]
MCHTVARAPAGAASAELHLTMNSHGTVWHDGILFCRALESTVSSLEVTRPDATTASQPRGVWQVNWLIKVFRDDLSGQTPAELRASTVRRAA